MPRGEHAARVAPGWRSAEVGPNVALTGIDTKRTDAVTHSQMQGRSVLSWRRVGARALSLQAAGRHFAFGGRAIDASAARPCPG